MTSFPPNDFLPDDPRNAMRLSYSELKRVAHMMLRGEHNWIQTTLLTHEAWLRHARHLPTGIDPVQSFPLVCEVIRYTLIDLIRENAALKRGDGLVLVPFDLELHDAEDADNYWTLDDFSDLHSALAALGNEHSWERAIAELKFFGGASNEEIALALRCDEMAVRGAWRFARAWLRRRLKSFEQ